MTRKQLQHRINALQSALHERGHGEDSDDTADEADTAVRTAPVGAKAGGGRATAGRPSDSSSDRSPRRQRRCFKCDSPDHGVAECKSKKELRSCLACHQQGHLVAACPQVRRTGAGGSGEEGAPRPKNE
jgi:hypothetical protein